MLGKRVLDIVLASVTLILLSPLLLMLAFAVYLKIGSPIFFRQVRSGLHSKPFVIYKFRTMLDLQDEHGNLLPDEKRLTKLGKFLCRFSLDEIPELWNVLKGEFMFYNPERSI